MERWARKNIKPGDKRPEMKINRVQGGRMKETYKTARINKDKNFDGKFFFGVKTTGIFCRPSCPAPVAKEENVVYFKDIFEALDQFYRPCLRCRPDINLDYYNGNASGTLTVQTALKMIYDGYLNFHSVADLAGELKVSSALRGIGEWTVSYVAMRGLGMVDSFPATDLGIIKALEKNGKRPGKKEILKRAERWRPYRAYAALCLWNQ